MNSSIARSMLPQGSLVLVTGSSGFIASHIVDQLLLAGYTVRGSVRTERQLTWTEELFLKRHGPGKYSSIVVPDMTIPNSFDDAVKGVVGIIHTASILHFSPDPKLSIPQTIFGVVSLLQSASKEPSVKSFVYTSSSVAAIGGGPNIDLSIDASTWNNAQIEEAWSITSPPFPATHPFVVYGASKAEAERALWKYVSEEKPSFRVNSILPDANFGEILSAEGSSSTGGWVRSVFASGVEFVKTLPPAWFVDVADTARLHVAALALDSVANERIFAFAAPYTWNEVLAIMRVTYPTKKFAEDIGGAEKSRLKVPTQRGEQLLRDIFGRDGWTTLEETIKKNLSGLS